MLTPIDEAELIWLADWLHRTHAHYVPAGYKRHIVILHPGARVERRPDYVPVAGPSSVDGEPARDQVAAIARMLTGTSEANTHGYVALYHPCPDDSWAPTRVGDTATFIETNVAYALLGGPLEELLRCDWASQGAWVNWVSMLWPTDRSWFLTSDPDSTFTVFACDDDLAAAALAQPILRATEIPDYRWDRC